MLRPKFRKALKMVHSQKDIEVPMITIEKDISKQSNAESVTTIAIDDDEDLEECRIVNTLKNSQEPDLVHLESENDDLVSENCDLVIDEVDTNPMFVHQPIAAFNFKTLGVVTA